MIQERLFTPGPTPLPASVLEILGRPALHHRTADFQTVLARVTAGLMQIFDTRQPVLTLTGSGSAGLEAALVNLASPGDTIAVLNAGKFGERWGAIARAYGLRVVELARPWGHSFQVDEVARFLDKEAAKASILCLTHCETSTGALHPLDAIAGLARVRGKLVVADVITSLGVHPVRFDSWGLDAAVAGSQKGLMLPPGLAFVALSETAWEQTKTARLPKFYLDLTKARGSINKNSTPFTPGIPLVLALEESIRLIQAEGMDAVFARHQRHADACRAAVKTWGLDLFASGPANGLTAVRVPSGKDGQEVVRVLRESHGMRIAGGQEPMKGKMFRLGHMGHYADAEVHDLITATQETLISLGWTEATDGVSAAAKFLNISAAKA